MRSDGLGGTVTTDLEYPARVAFVLLTQLLDEFSTTIGDSWKTVTAPESVSFPPMEEYLQHLRSAVLNVRPGMMRSGGGWDVQAVAQAEAVT